MAVCTFAKWHPISGPSGPYVAGPFRIVHHTTEGASAEGAFSAFAQHRSDPHFTVDDMTIYQHVDTNQWSRSLEHPSGTEETNRASAIQIEVVGFAGRRKSKLTLRNVARLCRWIERTHDVPKVWPSGFPRFSTNGQDPGGHNRDAVTWKTKGGHYGHSQVPNNVHWDPGYTADEVEFLMSVDPDAGILDEVDDKFPDIPMKDPGLESAVSTTTEHAELTHPQQQ